MSFVHLTEPKRVKPAEHSHEGEAIQLATTRQLASGVGPDRGDEAISTRPEDSQHVTELPPVDHGFGAWSFLVACFFAETIVWGFPSAFGVFLDAYLRDPRFANQRNAHSLLPLTGNLTSGIMFCAGPFAHAVMYRYPQWRQHAMYLGAAICFTSLFAASFTTDIRYVVFYQGVLYALGGVLLYNPCLSYTSEWFVVRRGFANGVIYAGTAVGGLILPLILPSVIERQGAAKALRMLAIVVGAFLLPALPFLKGRLPPARVQGPSTRSVSGRLFRNPGFHVALGMNTFQGFGYFVPLVWLPTFATEMKLSATNASIALAVLNGSSVIGRLGAGTLSDIIDPWILALSTLLGSCLATFILWGVLSHTLGGLIAFGFVYGLIAGGWTSMWNGFIRPISPDDPKLATKFIGYMMLSTGVGNILSTPISTALTKQNASSMHARLGFDVGGGKFENVIIYAGMCFAGATVMAGSGWLVEQGRAGRTRGL